MYHILWNGSNIKGLNKLFCYVCYANEPYGRRYFESRRRSSSSSASHLSQSVSLSLSGLSCYVLLLKSSKNSAACFLFPSFLSSFLFSKGHFFETVPLRSWWCKSFITASRPGRRELCNLEEGEEEIDTWNQGRRKKDRDSLPVCLLDIEKEEWQQKITSEKKEGKKNRRPYVLMDSAANPARTIFWAFKVKFGRVTLSGVNTLLHCTYAYTQPNTSWC